MDDTINAYLDSINNSIEQIRSNKVDFDNIDKNDLPSDFKLMMGNTAGNSKILQFIFDSRLDKVIDNLLDKILMGDFSDIDKYSDTIKKVFNMVGIGEDAFSGQISQTLLMNITNSVNSINFMKTKTKIQKCMLVLKNLKRQAKDIENKQLKSKYLEAVYAFKQTLKFISKVYKDRRIITNRVRKGLNIAIHESIDLDEELELDF